MTKQPKKKKSKNKSIRNANAYRCRDTYLTYSSHIYLQRTWKVGNKQMQTKEKEEEQKKKPPTTKMI